MQAPLSRPRPRPWAEIAEELERFHQSYQVNKRLGNYYERFRVLHINWDNASRDNDCSPSSTPTLLEHSLELQETFEKWYNYETRRINLPHDSEDTAYNRLAEAIRQETEGSTKHDLLILHYQGHGMFEVRQVLNSQIQQFVLYYNQRLGSSSLKWADDQPPTEQMSSLNFTEIREAYIDNAPCHVLMLMDCCHAGATGCGPPCSGKEVLAASSVRNASYLGEGSFTKNINSILRDACDSGSILPTSVLLLRLWANYHIQRVIGENTKKLEAEPVHVPLHPSFDAYAPIIIAPLSSVFQQCKLAMDFLLDRRLPFVRVDCYCSDDHLDMYDLQRNFRGKLLYGRINVHNAYRTGSYVVELSICISTWYTISHHQDLYFRHVIGPEKLNPPDFRTWDYPSTYTIQPKIVPEHCGNPSKSTVPWDDRDTSEKKEGEPWA